MFYEMYSAISSISFLLVLIISFRLRDCAINNTQFRVIFVIFFLITLTGLFKGFEIGKYILSVINLTTSLFLVAVIPYERFTKCFSNIIYLSCIFSLVGQVSFTLGLPFIENLPVLTNSKGIAVYFAGLAEFWTKQTDGIYRLQGFFWEPGAYQAMIIISFLFDIYINKPSKKIIRYSCYIVTIILTYSTTGIVSLLILAALISVKGKTIRYRNIFAGLLFALVCITLIPFLKENLTGFLYYSTFGKLELFNDAYTYGESNSASSRYESIIFPLKEFLDSPIFGIGEVGLERIEKLLGHNMLTCTPINFFAYYGFACGLICYYGIFKLLRLYNKSILEGLTLIILLLITVGSENFAYNPILTCLILYGYTMKSNISNKKNRLVSG